MEGMPGSLATISGRGAIFGKDGTRVISGNGGIGGSSEGIDAIDDIGGNNGGKFID